MIEEEVELEEQEDSPRARESNQQTQERRGEPGFKLYRTEEADEEDAKIDEEQEDLNEDIGVIEEDDEDEAFSNHSLLYERETPDGMILQVIHAPSGDPESVFIVR